jgi:hypothetical protein
MEQNTPRKVALVANCLLNQNAKVCEGARYPGVVSPVAQALRSRGYHLLQLPLPSPVRGAGGRSMSNMTPQPIELTAGAWHRRSHRSSNAIYAMATR